MAQRAKQIGANPLSAIAAGLGYAGTSVATSTGGAVDLIVVGEGADDGRTFTYNARTGAFRWLEASMDDADLETLSGLDLSAALERARHPGNATELFASPALRAIDSLAGLLDRLAFVEGVGLVERGEAGARTIVPLSEPVHELIPWVDPDIMVGVSGTEVFAVSASRRELLSRFDVGEFLDSERLEGVRVLEDGRVACVSSAGVSHLELLKLDLRTGDVELHECRDIPVRIGSVAFASSVPTPASMMTVFAAAAAAGAGRRITGQRSAPRR